MNTNAPICKWKGKGISESSFICHSPIEQTAEITTNALCLACGFRNQDPITNNPIVNTPTKIKINKTPCQFLGSKTGKKKDCDFCGGAKDVEIYECAIHKECTVNRQLSYKELGVYRVWVKFCLTCEDHQKIIEPKETTLFPLIQVTNPTQVGFDHSE